MKPLNRAIKNYLKENGITGVPKYIETGTMKGTIRIYNKNEKVVDGCYCEEWTGELINKFIKLGFKDFDNKEISLFSGNGGKFSVFFRNNNLINKLKLSL